MKFAIPRRTLFRFSRFAAVALVCVLAAEPPAPAVAEGSLLPDFLTHLFGGAPAAKPPDAALPAAPRKPRKKPRDVAGDKVRDFVPASATRAPGAPGGTPVQVSFYIDVIGDSLATETAEGLTDAFADIREIAVLNKARDPSGLVRDDYFDWPKSSVEIAAGKDKDKVDFAVVMVGINDGQPLRDGNEALETLSDRWRARYGERVAGVLAPFRAAHIPVAWVGLPPMRSDKANAVAIKLNEIYKEQAEKADAKYIDIWDAFEDQDGQYDAFGPNVDGQNVKLRGVDGIHFTKAGARKVAHFLEAEIHRVYDKNAPPSEVANLPPDIEHAADDINAQIRREMGAIPNDSAAPEVQPKPAAGPILSLTARPMSPGGVLATSAAGIGMNAEAARALRRGDPTAAHDGRADDFSWPRL